MKDYFKVVYEISHNEYCSAVVWGEAKTIYKLHKWIKAPYWLKKKGYHPAVFDDISGAKNFIHLLHANKLKIFKCRVRGIIKNIPKPLNVYAISSGKIAIEQNIFYEWSEHTIMAKKVKLIEEINIY